MADYLHMFNVHTSFRTDYLHILNPPWKEYLLALYIPLDLGQYKPVFVYIIKVSIILTNKKVNDKDK